MSKLDWRFWAVPLVLWGLYTCWYFGYQSGYTDGHETAWSMAKPREFLLPEIASSGSDFMSRAAELSDSPNK